MSSSNRRATRMIMPVLAATCISATDEVERGSKALGDAVRRKTVQSEQREHCQCLVHIVRNNSHTWSATAAQDCAIAGS